MYSFQKVFKMYPLYDGSFLQSLSNGWERVLDENKSLNLKLQQIEKEVAKLREVETSLYKTLKTAEDTGTSVIEQANKAAELHMKETRMNAEVLLNESKNKSRTLVEQAEMEARQIIEDLQDAVKIIEQSHRDIENQRQLAIQELKNLSVTLIEKVERNTQETKEFRFDDYVKRVKKLARENEERIKLEKAELSVTTKDLETPLMDVRFIKPDSIREKREQKQPSLSRTEELRGKNPNKKVPLKKVEEPLQQSDPMRREKIKHESVKENRTNVNQSLKPKIEKSSKTNEDVNSREVEEKNGPRILKTVSFFDELDTDS